MPVMSALDFHRVVGRLLLLVNDSAPQVRNVPLNHARLCRCFDQVHVCGIVHARVHGGDDGGDIVLLKQGSEGVDASVVGS
jgi:hypothetical protein